MITISKGDIVVEPIELLIQFVFRAFMKPYFNATPNTSISQWGVVEWVWTAITAAIILTICFYSIRFFSSDVGVKKTKK
jgi:heme/copper-type cytochrome/quinol oxidase subunit 2